MKVTALTLKKHFIVVLVSVLLVTPFLMITTKAETSGYANLTTYYVNEDVSDDYYYDGSSGNIVYKSTVVSNLHISTSSTGYVALFFTFSQALFEPLSYVVEGATVSTENVGTSYIGLTLQITADTEDVYIQLGGIGYGRFSSSEIVSASLTAADSTVEDIQSSVSDIALDVADMDTLLSGISSTVGNIYNSLDDLVDYHIEYESLPIYLYLQNLSSSGLKYVNGDLAPMYYLDKTQYNSYYAPYRFMVPANTTIYFSYFSQQYTEITSVYTSDGSSDVSLSLIYSEAGYYWKKYTWAITNSSSSSKLVSPYFVRTSNSYVIPLYMGNGRNMSLEMSTLTKIPTSTIYTDRQDTANNFLSQIKTYVLNIYNLLVDDNGESDSAVSTADQLSDAVTEYQGVESDFTADFSSGIGNITSNDSWDISQFSATVGWFSSQLSQIYDHSGDFKILFTLPMLLGIALFFIGRGHMVGGAYETERFTITEDLSDYMDKKEGVTRTLTKTRTQRKRMKG